VPSAGFEHSIPENERPQTQVLYREATGVSLEGTVHLCETLVGTEAKRYLERRSKDNIKR